MKELTDHIVEAYHVPKLINKVASVHGKAHPAVIQIESTFRSFKEDIELHMQKEEMILFPGMAKVEAGKLRLRRKRRSSIDMMTQEHEGAADALEKMRTPSNN